MPDDERAANGGDPEGASAPGTPSRALELTGKVPFLWALVVLVGAALGGAAAFVLLGATRGPRPPFLDAPSSATTSVAPGASSITGSRGNAAANGLASTGLAQVRLAPTRVSPTALTLAGSGSNLPLTRALVEAFRKHHPETKIFVHASIGSGGGVRAVRDGAVDIGLVSRALTEEEGRLGLVVTPHVRVAVVVATHPSVPDRCVASAELAAILSGARSTWSDGSRRVVLLRERGDSSFLAVSRGVPGLAEENDAAYRAGRWRVLYDDRAMQEALVSTEGAMGVFDLGAIASQRLPIKVLCVDGVTASNEEVVAGRYPFWKDLAFVTDGPAGGLRADLLRFAGSEEGRALAASLGYIPLPIEGGARAQDGGAP